MSTDAPPEVPELDAASRAFLESHEKTGEPTTEELARVGAKVASLAKLTPAPIARRRLVPPEVWAVAAVLALVVGVQGLYVLFRHPELSAVADDALVQVDAGPRAAAAPPSATDLLARAKQERTDRHLERAVELLEQCIELEPRKAECHRQLGAVLATLAARDNNATARDRARAAYERFLEVADASDPNVAKVKTILETQPPAPLAVSDPVADVVVPVGGERSLKVPRMQRVAIGDASIADVRTIGADTLVLKGMAPGKTTLLIWLNDGTRRSWLVQVR